MLSTESWNRAVNVGGCISSWHLRGISHHIVHGVLSLRYGKGKCLFAAKEVGVSLGMGLYALRKMERAECIAAININLVKHLRPALLNQAAEPPSG
jgi:hypothetical protein